MRTGWLRWGGFAAIPGVLGLAVIVGWATAPTLPTRLLAGYGALLLAAAAAGGLLLAALRRVRRADERRRWWPILLALACLTGWVATGPGVWLVGHRTPDPAWGAGFFLLTCLALGWGLVLRGGRLPRTVIGLAALLGDALLIPGAMALVLLERGQFTPLLPFGAATAVAWAYAGGLTLLLLAVTVMLSGAAPGWQRGPRWLLAAAVGLLAVGGAALGRLPLITLASGFPLAALLWAVGLPLMAISAHWEVAARPHDAAAAREMDAYLGSLGMLPPALLLAVGAGLALAAGPSALPGARAAQLCVLLGVLLLLALGRALLHALHTRLAYLALLGRVRESERAAVTDPLTGLPNTRACTQRLADEVARAARYQRPLAVIFADIDFFKLINDVHGHGVGDDALCAVAHTLRDRIRTMDMAARLGGEEFVLILPETTLSQADILAERLRQAIENLRLPLPGGGVLRMTISLGIAAYPETSDNAEGLLHDADAAMGRAKEAGRNRVMHARAKSLLFVFE
ncbi:MAG TPA: GGDEF domain-containing protein [Armatimonadota bacterium]|nr:GGDEF domain-containing protein [Armatimonadota bacterium]HOS42659.1 GGDEF domain-containing protein [Armatimonadota bacterium]